MLSLSSSFSRALVALFAFMATGSSAADFRPVTSNESYDTIHMIDHSSAIRKGQLVRVWEMSDTNEDNPWGVKSSKSQYEFNCKTREMRSLAAVGYALPGGYGKVLVSENRTTEWQSVVPGSVLEALLLYSCKHF